MKAFEAVLMQSKLPLACSQGVRERLQSIREVLQGRPESSRRVYSTPWGIQKVTALTQKPPEVIEKLQQIAKTAIFSKIVVLLCKHIGFGRFRRLGIVV